MTFTISGIWQLNGVLFLPGAAFLPVAVPLVAFGPAAVVIWRRSSSSPHGGTVGKSP